MFVCFLLAAERGVGVQQLYGGTGGSRVAGPLPQVSMCWVVCSDVIDRLIADRMCNCCYCWLNVLAQATTTG